MWFRKTFKPNHWSYQIEGQIQRIVKGLKTLDVLFSFIDYDKRGIESLKM
jgi:hypothetical protein